MGNLKFGTNSPLALYMGVSGSTKAYYGTTVVYSGGTPIDYSKEYLTFEILTGGTIYFIKNNGIAKTIDYSTDNGTSWTQLPLAQHQSEIVVSAGDKVMFRGTTSGTSEAGDTGYYCAFSGGTATYNIYGNIMSLASYPNFETASLTGNFKGLFKSSNAISAENLYLPNATVNFQYRSLFSTSSNLITAPTSISGITAVKEYAFLSAFSGCTSLRYGPVPSAVSSATGCYREMYSGCTSLTSTVSALTFETVNSNMCTSMYAGCTSLTTAPEIPVTGRANNAYTSMFSNCTSLTKAPSILPATSVNIGMYQSMFEGCTSLTTAPEMPSASIQQYSHRYMFRGCTNLNYVKCLAPSIGSSSGLTDWLLNVAATGTFVKNANMSSWPSGASGIPSGWTVVDATYN